MIGPERESGVWINWEKLLHAGQGERNAYAKRSRIMAKRRKNKSFSSFGRMLMEVFIKT